MWDSINYNSSHNNTWLRLAAALVAAGDEKEKVLSSNPNCVSYHFSFSIFTPCTARCSLSSSSPSHFEANFHSCHFFFTFFLSRNSAPPSSSIVIHYRTSSVWYPLWLIELKFKLACWNVWNEYMCVKEFDFIERTPCIYVKNMCQVQMFF